LRLNPAWELGMRNSAVTQLLPPRSSEYPVQPDGTPVLGTQKFAGAMLVIQGSVDSVVPEQLSTAAVASTCNFFPQQRH